MMSGLELYLTGAVISSMPDLKLLFFRTLLDWFSVWRNHQFSSILDFLDFCNVRFWFVLPCIPPVYLGVFLFLLSMNFYYLSKKKKDWQMSSSSNGASFPYKSKVECKVLGSTLTGWVCNLSIKRENKKREYWNSNVNQLRGLQSLGKSLA